jgi:hypothetical protein
MTDSQILDAAEAYEEERKLWGIRTNKMNPPETRYEVVRIDQVAVGCPTMDTAEYEREEQMMLAAMKKALQRVNG